MSAYAQLADVKTFMGITGTTDDALLTRLITAASSFVENYCNRSPGGFSTLTLAEVRNGNGKGQMTPIEAPIINVTGVVVNGLAITAMAAPTVGFSPNSPSFAFDDNTIYLYGMDFCKGVKNVLLNYTAGFATVPDGLVQCVIDMVALKYKSRDRIGKTSEALAGIGQVVYLVRELPADMTLYLDSLKRVAYVTEY